MYTRTTVDNVLDDTCSVCVGQNRSPGLITCEGVGVQVLLKVEGQVTKWQTKYAATPKQEVLERLKENVKQLTATAQQQSELPFY